MNTGSRTMTIGGVATLLLVIGVGLWVVLDGNPPPIRVGVGEVAPPTPEPPEELVRTTRHDPEPEYTRPEQPGKRAIDMTPEEIERRRGDTDKPLGVL